MVSNFYGFSSVLHLNDRWFDMLKSDGFYDHNIKPLRFFSSDYTAN